MMVRSVSNFLLARMSSQSHGLPPHTPVPIEPGPENVPVENDPGYFWVWEYADGGGKPTWNRYSKAYLDRLLKDRDAGIWSNVLDDIERNPYLKPYWGNADDWNYFRGRWYNNPSSNGLAVWAPSTVHLDSFRKRKFRRKRRWQ